ncbi:MAG: ATP-binding protein [Desulfobacterales bacterium]|nr:ATP-binding protein [Desulfobacterales bacterium]
MYQSTNPFIVGDVIPPDAPFCERTGERQELEIHIHNARNVVIWGHRRFGKTSLVFRVARDTDVFRGTLINCAFFGISSPQEVVRRIQRGIWNALTAAQKTLEWFKGLRYLRPRVDPDPNSEGGFSIGIEATREGLWANALEEAIGKLHSDLPGPVLVIFDEFQAIAQLKEGPEIEGLLREQIQHRPPQVSYIFIGSQRGMLQAMFSDKHRPFFQQAQAIEIDRLGKDEVISYLTNTFADFQGLLIEEQAGRLFEACRGHPYAMQAIAAALWDQTEAGTHVTDRAIEGAIRLAADREMQKVRPWWARLRKGDRFLLEACAREGSFAPYSREVAARYGLSPSGIRKSIENLVDLDPRLELIETGKQRRIQFVDPLESICIRRLSEGYSEPVGPPIKPPGHTPRQN